MNEHSSPSSDDAGLAGSGGLPPSAADRIVKAVEAGFEAQVAFLEALVRQASLRGEERAAQDIVAGALAARGYEIRRFAVDAGQIGRDPAFSPTTFDLKDADIVVGLKPASARDGRSLALNAHVDVVPAGPDARWTHPPFSPVREGDWLYGRGAGDMKAGLVANLFALDAIAAAGFDLRGAVQVQSVIEEETTGNGAAMVLARGFAADAVLIPEPTGETVVRANTGVMKFAITVEGVPAHPLEVAKGRSAIDVAIRAIAHLRTLERQWLAERSAHPDFDGVDNPVALTIGTIAGGEWLASVPSECRFEGRIGFYPGDSAADRAGRFAAFLEEAFRTDPELRECPPPRLEWVGVQQGGYRLAPGSDAETCLARAHSRTGPDEVRPLERSILPAYLDAAVFALHGGMTSLVYGPIAENIHAVDERVSLSSLRRVTQTIALFAAAWCGIDERPASG